MSSVKYRKTLAGWASFLAFHVEGGIGKSSQPVHLPDTKTVYQKTEKNSTYNVNNDPNLQNTFSLAVV